MGEIFRKCNKFRITNVRMAYIVLLIVVLSIIGIFITSDTISYFNIFCIPLSLSVLVVLYNISYLILKVNRISSVFIYIGKMTYILYLVHIQIAGFVNNKLYILNKGVFPILKVVIAFVVTLFFVLVMKCMMNKIHIVPKIQKLLGFS